MARREKTATPTVVDQDARRRTVEKLIGQGKLKDAFKEAKFYYHREASPENHLLVERTYLLRIQSLLQGGMTSAAREVASNLLEFGVTDPKLTRELLLLLPDVGLGDKALALQASSPSPEMAAQLTGKLADRAVVHPEDPATPEMREAAAPIRSALAALDVGNEPLALELLQVVPRHSPMADWRYFIRGLCAFQRKDLDQARANWDRLDATRASRKIANVLLGSVGQPPDGIPRQRLHGLESAAFGEQVLDRLDELRRHLEARDWKRAMNVLAPLRASLERIDIRYSQRLTGIVLSTLAEEASNSSYREAQQLIAEARTALAPLSWDPGWHRFEALVWEAPQGGPDGAINCWRAYLADLERGIPLPCGELRQVQALVWRRIGKHYATWAHEMEFAALLSSGTLGQRLEELREHAVDALRQSAKLDPTRREPYEMLIDEYEEWDEPEQVYATLEEMLQAFPDDVDVLARLIGKCRASDRPEQALEWLRQLRRLRPLDPGLDSTEAWCLLGRARLRALEDRLDEARADLDRVGTTLVDHVLPYRLFLHRAAVEYRAGDAKRAEEWIDRARGTVKEPTVLWLELAISAIRFELPPRMRKRFERELESSLSRKTASETAGKLAELISIYRDTGAHHGSEKKHLDEVVRYLGRTRRLKYEQADLRHVCKLLKDLGNKELLADMCKRGQKLFPSSPAFLLMEAELAIDKGPRSLDARKVEKKLEKALALAETSPADAALVPTIKKTLVAVRDMDNRKRSSPFGFGRGRMPSAEEFEDFFDSFLDSIEDEDGPDDERPPPKRRRPKPR